LYADALEFDYSGDYLVYDCFNRLENSDGSNIEYWDVNFIRVWNTETNSFGDGEIFKLFTSLPENVSIGNPTFSKNSTNIIAFDYFSSNPETYSILGCNIETSQVNTMIQNNSLGWPSFNKDDSRIAFSSFSSQSEPEIGYALLNPDKLSVQGEVLPMFLQAKWPVYYSTGTRQQQNDTKEINTDEGLACFPNPFTDELIVHLPESRETGSIELFSSMGQKLGEYSTKLADNNVINLNLSNLKPGIYYLKFKGSRHYPAVKIVKE
jgi:hypothetical protein